MILKIEEFFMFEATKIEDFLKGNNIFFSFTFSFCSFKSSSIPISLDSSHEYRKKVNINDNLVKNFII